MKINKLWIVIILILVVGCLSTSYTKRYRDQRASAAEYAAEETFAVAGVAAKDAPTAAQEPDVQEGAGVFPEASAAAPAPKKAESFTADATLSDALPEEDAGAAMDVSEQAAEYAVARAALPSPESADGERTNGYLNRLKDLDARIEKEHASSGDTTNSLKAAAEQERKLWETELNRILKALEERISDEDMKTLFKEQKEWMRERENIAVESSKKKNGSALEEVEYNVSLADTTRERAYELAEQYAAVLTGAE
ncbi:MAG: DUF1311 domain-containing protein [Lachnospiraceae bacterium]|nr:DUF1311 domain-containing protein [Lachnospiraceae bacterium]